ncbi:tRNA (N6-isopentenyl adenosine(37)-C2)-methylthiotransferase MiaB [Gilvimarinus agarilyticus]|uniref:tRNA-2-methylthio-N(6)-dimethylallyladenosine synthase n=1 Tax=Reichenbachiella agariperforans TaxID=156994 RepID=A0A1M6JZ29_REIAG|nr:MULTISPECIES: tRNA (N6-isopentenyl adenosine(37)-C2)-methylthiotransferase MiaB [Reichenbachiella]MBU2888067.1 tRNA (N6-isopentenyl adenosine(37)-C2)-methylthiotransferase MiaB [Gilvimarinus agarilyticus]MBU2913359.1 tRNA (N6-isopentenyl adenosine(37)-C2)-methylthiotransferase MiaB [Reichenbachiella agariperforans]RJE74657.1 tRNA (N6-isopentenyl adenosine(37)-C2)-methylthiotransferase MiaB [Reichenbachiella sp. MSK19-1]SHJ51944.1 tRNA-2-methylthio-N6-dimethylallyladenosine synthase [Reichenb
MKGLISDLDILNGTEQEQEEVRVSIEEGNTGKKKLYIESYGCQMNFSDSEIVSSIMKEQGYTTTSSLEDADVTFLNTCSIREKAEQTVRNRLNHINAAKKRRPEMVIGVLGCMAERLKSKFLEEEKIVDLVVGPDAYRDLPNLLGEVESGQKAVNTFLSREETYADISPVRLNSNGVTAFISIMRGCDNMCSFCVVPFTRGRERSRDPFSIVKEAQDLFDKGFKEVTLLGQNVDSYKWSAEQNNKAKLEKSDIQEVINFANLLEMVAKVDPKLRVRFSTSHPKDITDEVLHTMKAHDNICKYIHLPVQSGNSRILDMMNRTYDRAWYINRVDKIKEILGEDCGLSSDMITGFCSETEEEHQDTLSLMRYVKYDLSYMFFYSERPGTLAEKKYEDDIPLDIKKRRLNEIIELQNECSRETNRRDVGKEFEVLIEGTSKKSEEQLFGRTTTNKVVIFDKGNHKKGEYVTVKINDSTTGTLFGTLIEN